ncbi:MAG: F0F1 ATP synthase subunit A [Syntrophotaleaceae bacterium]
MVHPFLFMQWLVEKLGFGFTSEELHHYGYFNHITYAWVTMGILVLLAWLAARKLSTVPGKMQNFMEVVFEQIERLMGETMGRKGRPYFPLICTLALFILVSNLIALLPGFMPPTANLNTNGALALTVFFGTHIIGVKEHGLKYLKHFTGPIWWLIPLMLPIELIGHVARPVSLTLRLFGNMYGHEVVLMIFLFLAPFIVPLPMMLMGVLIAFIQTFVFTLLTMIYIAGALEEAH